MATKAMIFGPALSGLRFDGAAASGYYLYFYEPGTTTLRAVYTTRNKTAQAANPFGPLDANGQGEVFLDGVYDIVVKSTLGGTTKATWEGYEGTSPAAANLPVEIPTTMGSVVQTLPTNSEIASYVKSTNDVNVVTFTTSDGSTIAESTFQLDSQYNEVTFCKVGAIWYRKQ